MRLIDADALYERATTLEAQALDYVGKLIERDGDESSVEWKIWSDILAERTAFKHDLMDAPTVDAVKATMPWTNPDGTETMLDEVSYEIGYSQGQKDTKRQGYWVRFYGDHIQMGLRPKWDCCSECGMVGTPTRFCSNCGARMDGEL